MSWSREAAAAAAYAAPLLAAATVAVWANADALAAFVPVRSADAAGLGASKTAEVVA